MTTPIPASTPSDGNVKATWVPAFADPANPTVSEIEAAGAFDVSCYLTGDGLNPGADEQTVTDPRLCSRQDFEQPGRLTDSLEVGYVYRAQEPLSATNKAFTTLKRGTAGYLVLRWGLAYETAWATSQIVDVYPAKCGVQRKQQPEGNSILKVMQKMFVTGEVERDVVVV